MKLKKLCVRLLAAAVLTGLLAASASAAGAGNAAYTSSYSISNRLNFVNTISYNAYGRQSGYIMEYSPGGDIKAVVCSGRTVYGKRTITTAAKALTDKGLNVLGGVNADFFSTTTGIPLGALVEDGKLLTVGDSRNVVGFNEDGSAFYSENPSFSMVITNNGGGSVPENAGQQVTVHYYNQQRRDSRLYLLSSDYYENNQASVMGKDVLFKIADGDNSSVTPSCTVELEVTNIFTGSTPTEIPEGYLLLTANNKCPYYAELDKFSVGDRAALTVSCSDERIAQAKYVTGCGDILAKDGAKTDESGWDKALGGANPRTALGIRGDGTVLLYAADGRQSSAAGLTMNALAEELIARQCETVINLDGGGSTSCVFRMPGSESLSLVNSPSGGSARLCSTYIFIVSENARDGIAKQLYFSPNDPVVLAGSTVSLGSIIATDGGYYPAAVPSELEYSAQYGAMDGITYTAPETACQDTVTAVSPEGAWGESLVTVLDDISSFTVSKTGSSSPLSSITAIVGETAGLSVSVPDYYGQEVHFSADAFSYGVTGGVGTITENGVFTAGAAGTGSITVSFGSRTVSIPVTVCEKFYDVAPGHWASQYISALAERGVIQGVTDTSFKPESNITREEFCVMLSRFLNLDTAAYSAVNMPFSDRGSISGWAAEHVRAMYALGYIQGSGTGSDAVFNPKSYITRAEICTILGRIFGGESGDISFTDSSAIPSWAVSGVGQMAGKGVVNGYSDGSFRPMNNATRAEVAKMIYKLS